MSLPLPPGLKITDEGARKAGNKLKEAIHSTEQQLTQVQTIHEEYSTLSSTLSSLPEKLSHNIMVPFGPMAFFPGKIVHTNEVLVLLGQNYFVDQTVPKAVAIIDRRKKHLEESKTKLNEQLTSLKSKLQIAQQLANSLQEQSKGEVVDIREDYNSDEEKKKEKKMQSKNNQQPKKKSKTKEEVAEDDEIFSRLAKLEEQEDRMESGESSSSTQQILVEDDEDEDEDGDEGEGEDEDEDEEDEEDDEEIDEEQFDLQKEFEKMKLARQQRRERGQVYDEDDRNMAPNTLEDLATFLDNKGKEPQQDKSTPEKGKKKVSFAQDTKSNFPPGVTVMPNVKPTGPSPFSGNIVERDVEPLPEEEQEAPKKVSKFKAARMKQ